MNATAEWLAVYTAPRHEKSVARHLGQRCVEYYLPLYSSQRSWRNGVNPVVDLPLFPGYLFVRIAAEKRRSVLGTPGVFAIVGGAAGQPACLSDGEIEALRSCLKSRRPEPHPLLQAGQRVRIRSGAMAGFEGIVLRKKGGLRVVLTLTTIMKSIAVEVDESELESSH